MNFLAISSNDLFDRDPDSDACAYTKLMTRLQAAPNCAMPGIIEIPIELTRFQLPQVVQAHLQFLLNRQDEGNILSQAERQEAERLVELAEFLSLLRLTQVVQQLWSLRWSCINLQQNCE